MNKRWGCALLFVVLLLFGSLAANLALVFACSWSWPTFPSLVAGRDETKTPRFDQQPIQNGSLLAGKVAVLPIRGVISDDPPGELGGSMVDDIIFGLQQAVHDKTSRPSSFRSTPPAVRSRRPTPCSTPSAPPPNRSPSSPAWVRWRPPGRTIGPSARTTSSPMRSRRPGASALSSTR